MICSMNWQRLNVETKHTRSALLQSGNVILGTAPLACHVAALIVQTLTINSVKHAKLSLNKIKRLATMLDLLHNPLKHYSSRGELRNISRGVLRNTSRGELTQMCEQMDEVSMHPMHTTHVLFRATSHCSMVHGQK